jgi:hypothetical protein
MSPSAIISISAIVISLTSLGFSIYVAMRDRPRLKASCVLYHPNPDLPWPYPSVGIRAVNTGRRIVILTKLGRYYGKNRSASELLDHEKGGRRLGENEIYERTLRNDLEDYTMLYYRSEEPENIEELWFEDTLGRKHAVRHSRKVLHRFWEMVREERTRQKTTKPSGA